MGANETRTAITHTDLAAVREAYLATNDPNERAKWAAVLEIIAPEYCRHATAAARVVLDEIGRAVVREGR